MFDTFQEILATLRRGKLRTFLTGISVSVGIFLLIVLLGAGNGIIHAFENATGTLALDVMNIFGGITSKPYNGMKEGRIIRLDTRDLGIASNNFKENVRSASGLLKQSSVNIQYGKQSITRDIDGVYPAYAQMTNSTQELLSGRFINEIDMRNRRRVLVITEKDADYLFGSWRSAIGKHVNADKSVYQVVGISPNASMSDNTNVYAPYSTLRTIANRGNKLDKISLKTSGITSDDDVDQYAARFRSISGLIHQYAPDDEDAVWMYNTSTGAEEVKKATGILRITLWVIGILTLLSGVVSISNIMLITVRERTHEFGIRKALGARPMSILRNVMFESIVITTLFGYAGMVLGVAATEYLNVVSGNYSITVENVTMTLFSDPTVDIATCLEALAVMILAGVIAGLIPARKAVKVKPIEALRAE